MPQPRMVDGDFGDPAASFMISDVRRQPVSVGLLEGEGHRDNPTVELRHGHLRRYIERSHALVRGGPGSSVPGQTQSLQDRDIEGSEGAHVPGFVVFTCGRGSRLRTAGRQHRRNQGIATGQIVQQVARCTPQRCGEDRDPDATCCIDSVRERLNVRGVSRGVLGAIEQDSDARQ